MNAVFLLYVCPIRSVFENIRKSPKETRGGEWKVRSPTLLVVVCCPGIQQVSRLSRYVLCVQDGSILKKKKHLRNTDGQGQVGDLGDIVVKEAGVGDDGVVGKGLDTSAGVEGRAGLVEGNVTIGTDTAQEELNATDSGDLLLVALALEIQVCCVAVEDVDVLGEDVDVLEEVAPHERVVGLGVISVVGRWRRKEGC